MKLIRLTESDLHKIVKESVQNVISEVGAMPNGFKHRFDPNKRDGDYQPPFKQPEWMKDPRWQHHDGEYPEWIMKQQKESGDPYYKNESKQAVRVSESQLHQIVKESVEQVLSEGWFGNDKRYGEKWWNPNTWMSDKEKREKDKTDKNLADIYNQRKQWDRERETSDYLRKMQMSHQKNNTKTSPETEKRTGYGDTRFGPADDGYFAGLR